MASPCGCLVSSQQAKRLSRVSVQRHGKWKPSCGVSGPVSGNSSMSPLLYSIAQAVTGLDSGADDVDPASRYRKCDKFGGYDLKWLQRLCEFAPKIPSAFNVSALPALPGPLENCRFSKASANITSSVKMLFPLP